jgi:hypothetical protein
MSGGAATGGQGGHGETLQRDKPFKELTYRADTIELAIFVFGLTTKLSLKA